MVIQRVEEALRLREKSLADVLKVVDDAEKQLDIYTDQLLQTVIELKQKTKARLDSIRNAFESILSDQSSALTKELSVAKDILEKVARATSECSNKSQQITCSHLATMTVQNCEDANRRLSYLDVGEILFQPHVTCNELFHMLFKYNSLGKFSILPLRKKCVCVPYKIVKKEKTSAQVMGDKRDCYISESFSLQDGTILLADYNNNCLKRLSLCDTYVSDCIHLSSGPWSVATISQKLAVVTLLFQKQVHIIAFDTTRRTIRTLKLGFECFAVTHFNNELFISDRNTVYVYTVGGIFLRQISDHSTGQTLFSDICNIVVSETGLVLFVADRAKGLVAVERKSGKQLWHYKGHDLKNATGVCVDGFGGVFVCGLYSNNVLQFSESGEKISEIVTQADGIEYPLSVCFETSTSTLVVTQDRNNIIMKYQLTT